MQTALTGDILIVDDVPANLRLLSGMLVEEGYTVRMARNGELALLGVKTAPPDLILLDINMPDLDGYEVCQQLKADARTRDIPIIFISARDQLEDKVKALAVGGVDYITKPFHPKEVLARVETHLKLYTLQRQLTVANAGLVEQKSRVEAAQAMLWTVLNNLDALIYVADMDTYEVLFANAQLKEVFGDVEGGTCWQTLQQGQAGPCGFCNNPDLVDDRGRATGIVRRQFQNTRNGRWYTVADSAITWVDGRRVRLSMAVDITAYKRAERQLVAQQRLTATLDERERIGRELHDDLGQVMSYVGVQSQAALRHLMQKDLERVRSILHQLAQVASEAHADVRQYILGVRKEPTPRPPDLFAALDAHLGTLQERYRLHVRVSRPDDLLESPLAPEVDTQLLRIIQEALTNVRKHAGVNTAQVVFTQLADWLQVVIADAGRGFDTGTESLGPDVAEMRRPDETPESPPPHFGLQIMRERAESVGGNLEVRSTPQEGTHVIVQLPLALAGTGSTESMRGLRVLLVDDHPLYLEGLRALLTTRGIKVVAEAYDGLEAQRLAQVHHPDLILMDVQMPGCDGIEATRAIKAGLPDVVIVVLTIAAEDELLFEALKAGASGYLLKSLPGAQFFGMLRDVMAGETVISPTLASQVLTAFANRDEDDVDETPELALTERQLEVLKLAAQGMTNQQIADALYISRSTVKYHVSQILERLQLSSRHQFGRYLDDV
jgi:two-component system NarL family response regulator